MKAIHLTGYGDIDQLKLVEIPKPEPQPQELLIKITATSLNPVDWKLRQGVLQQYMPLELPAILGHDISGEVVALGSEVKDFQIGDRVLGFGNRTYAEFVTAPAASFTRLPDGYDPIEAAALPLVLLTGAQLIELGVQPKQGETILISGAVGAVGRTAVYVAKQHGAKVIAAVRERQSAEAASIQADQIVAVEDATALKALPEFDALADTVSGPVIEQLIPKLKRNGVLGSVLGKTPVGERTDVKVNIVSAVPDAHRLGQLAAAVHRGEFEIPIAKRFPLSEIRGAHALAEKGGLGGKVLIIP